MFNDYVWNLYLNAGGKDVVNKFEYYLTENFSEEYADFIYQLRAFFCPDDGILKDTSEELRYLAEDLKDWIPKKDEYSNIEESLDTLYANIYRSVGAEDKEIFGNFAYWLDYYSTRFSIDDPDLFVPYYFQYNYNVFSQIADEFGINLPPIPKKKEYKKRFYFYGKICEALLHFRKEHDLNLYELCAFLYDFAPKYIGGTDSYIVKDLPEPKSAYFIGGSKDDRFLSDDPDEIALWQCSPDTRVGDMVVMYLRSPISAVDSVWRSVSVGFNDPFFYYYQCTYIAHPRSLHRITQKELKEDKIFKNVPIVRKNMQGISGVELKPSEYNHLLVLGHASRKIPRLARVMSTGNQKYAVEKDVENKLVKPLLKKLGYDESDYVQQMYIEVGNHNHLLIPDFVLLPNRARGHQSAFAVVEAKYSIVKSQELEAAQVQVRSYAVQLRARYAAVMSKEAVWIWEEKDDFTDIIFSGTWEKLKKADAFSDLFKIIGKK